VYGDFVRQEPYTFATSAYWVPLSKLIKNVTSSEPAWAKWTMMELFMTDRHQHLPAATMLHVLDSTPLRHSRTSQCGRTASS
jgi:hypothetical protein